jgi:hypothetical protein
MYICMCVLYSIDNRCRLYICNYVETAATLNNSDEHDGNGSPSSKLIKEGLDQP